jgi:hypothetical protein
MASVACDYHYFNSQKAVNELGLPQNPIELATLDLYNWFKENGYL